MLPPVLYIIAGPNGIGKTTASFDIVPINIPIINSDEIAKHLRTAEIATLNTQEYSNREAQLLVEEHLKNKKTFAIETNLSDEQTWKFLIGVRKIGYSLHLVFLSTDDISLLNNRIKERHLRGEHFVRPDIVEERYYVSLQLLRHYFNIPDEVQLIDNSTALKPIAIKRGNIKEVLSQDLPIWFINYIQVHFEPSKESKSIKDLSSIEEVRKKYQQDKEKSKK